MLAGGWSISSKQQVEIPLLFCDNALLSGDGQTEVLNGLQALSCDGGVAYRVARRLPTKTGADARVSRFK